MTTKQEWKDLPTMQDVACAQADEWKIQFSDGNKVWRIWDGKTWANVWNFRARPRQPKMRTITLRKALLKTTTKDYWIIEGTCNYEAGNDFVGWIGEPYTVEVPE